MMKNIYFFLLTLLLMSVGVFSGTTASGQYTLLNPKVVDTFPYTETNLNTGDGETATGMQGACFTLPCCSVEVFKVILPSDGVLRVEMSNFPFLAGSIIAYYPTTNNVTSYSDIAYVSGTPGNFCGFRDTLMLGRAFYNWDAVPYGGTPTVMSGLTAVYDFNNPNVQAGYFPAGTYYVLVFNENQQTSQGIGNTIDLTFEFAEACAPLTVPSALTFDTLEYNAQSDTIGFYVKNDRTKDVKVDLDSIKITGTAANQYSVVTQPDSLLAVGDSTYMAIRFAPTAGGVQTASVEIPFADTVCSTSSSVALSGVGAEPTIKLLGNGLNINNNDNSPATSDNTFMGIVVTNTGAVTREFKITNTGTDTLELTGSPLVTLTGNSQFTIITQPTASVLPGDTTSFVVKFTPTTDGTHSATVSIANNDADKTPFQFDVEGTGAERNGLDFDGSNDYVNINSVAGDMTGVTALTVEAWVKVDPNQVGYDNFLAVNTSSNGNRMFIVMDDGLWEFWVGSTSRTLPGTDIRDDVWHHVAFVFDNGAITYYLDGVQTATQTNNTPTFSASDKWSIGQEWDNGGASDFFNGAVNEVRIWKTVRTAQEIAGDRYCEIQSPATDANLVAYYTFNQGVSGGTNTSITSITDVSGYANTGTPQNFALTGTASNFISATNVGTNCTSIFKRICDSDTYTSPSGKIYDSTALYIDTVTNSLGGDSILYIDLSLNFSQVTQDLISDTTVCDTIKEHATTAFTPFAHFNKSESDWIEINGSVDSLVNTNRSVFMWMRAAGQVNGSNQVLFGINSSGTATVSNFGIRTNEQLWIYDGGNHRNSGVTVTDGNWHFVGYTYDEGSNLTTFWVDGVAAASFSNGQSISATSRISLGQEFDGSTPSNFFDGDMAEVTIWNEVLSGTEITALMQASVQPSHPKYSHLKAHYPLFNQCSDAPTVRDFGPHNYAGKASAGDILITDSLATLSGYNAAPLYSKSWTRNGAQIATTDSLFLTTPIQGGTYGLNLNLDYFSVSDNWNVTVQPACAGLFAAVTVDSNVTCNGLSNGGASATGINGTAPYTFAWSNGATTTSITGVAAGTYTVTVTDGSGDTNSTSFSITEPTILDANTIITSNISTAGASDGVATAASTGGTTPYTYLWSNGATTSNISGLSAGTYTATVTDANGCVDNKSVTLVAPVAPAPGVIVITEINYNPPESGSDSTEYIELYNTSSAPVNMLGCQFTSGVVYTFPNVTINAGGYMVIAVDSVAMHNRFGVNTYQWSSGGLSNGGEPIALKDASNNLIDSLRYDDNSPWPTDPDGGGATLVLCDPNSDNKNGANWAASNILVSGQIINGKQVYGSPGVADGCVSNFVVSVTVDSNVTCNGLSNGGATGSLTGGTAPFSYAWNNGATTASITGVGAGKYIVTVTDNAALTTIDSVTITEPAALVTASTVNSHVTCNGAANGAAAVSATGGTAPYTYLWNNAATAASITGLGGGMYTVTVTDNNGCTSTSSETITEPSVLAVSATSGIDSIDVTVTGGTSPYTYAWSNGATTEDLNGVSSGTYTVTVTDGNGCTNTDTKTIVNPADYFVTTWKTDNAGVSNSTSIKIPTNSIYTYNYDVDWNGDGVFDEFGITGDATHDYGTAGTYTVKIRGTFPSIYFYSANSSYDNDKLLSVTQWGSIKWRSMSRAFLGCKNLSITATDAPDLSLVTNMSYMFNQAENFDSPIGHWNVSNATDVRYMFAKTKFNQNISTWDVSNVKYFISMFYQDTVFNQNIGNWNTSSALNTGGMFHTAKNFNQDISSWDVSSVVSMQGMFSGARNFNQNINAWDVSSVKNMKQMFSYADAFNQSLNSWNVGIVTTMEDMFRGTNSFNGDITAWDVSSVTTMEEMFSDADAFNQNIGGWNVSSVVDMEGMFAYTPVFNQNIGNWNVSSVTNMRLMFREANMFNQNIGSWNVSSVTNMAFMFWKAIAFNQNIGNWNVSSVTDMQSMFRNASVFNQNIGTWDVGSVTTMKYMFSQADAFDQNIGSWDVDTVVDMSHMFSAADVFNQDIGNWDVSKVTNMEYMFNNTPLFNQNIGNWNVSAVTKMKNMFSNAVVFNQDISGWDVSAVTTMKYMFNQASAFDQNLGNWNVSAVTDFTNMTNNATFSTANYDSLLIGWSTQSLQSGQTFRLYNSNFCEGDAARQSIITNFGWTFYDAGKACPLSLTISQTNITCNGAADGTALASTSAGTAPYTYAWSNGATTATINGLSAGTYTVTITDNNSGTSIDSVVITEPVALAASVVVNSNASCNGAMDGGATASATGGTTPFTYLWSGGQTTAAITSIGAGTYKVTITDSAGCTVLDSATITEPAAVAVSNVIIKPDCGISNGDINITVSGTNAPYTYVWSNGATTEDISSVASGAYTVTITDNSGCTGASSYNVNNAGSLTASSSNTDLACYGNTNGSVNVTTSGGTAPYTYAWSNGETTEDVNNLAAGIYTLTVTDNIGCLYILNDTIVQPDSISKVLAATSVSCSGGNDGAINNTVSGGTAPYTYAWSALTGSATTASITGIAAGNYTVTITDNNSCTSTGSVTVAEPVTLTAASVVNSNVTCNGLSNGEATASATGGTAPYTYAWSNTATAANLTGVAAGTYSVTITDSKSCTSTSSVTITEPAVFTAASVVDSNVTCNGLSNGGATASATGGTTPYTYAWSDSVTTTASITGVVAGTYSVTIADNNGCTSASSVTITEPATLIAASVVDSNVTCNGLSNGGASASATGGTMPYTYAWSNAATTASVTGVLAGTYTVTITDSKGCTSTSSSTVTQPVALIAATVVDSNVSCNGFSNGGASASATGGTMPYTYAWTASTGSATIATTASITGVVAGTYTVTITDNKGCTSTSSSTITEPAALVAASVVDSNITCNGLSNGGVTASATGGTTPYTYAWSNAATTASITGVAAGTYTVTITDNKGCTSTSSVTITEPAVLVAATVVDSTITCNGLSNGGATASVTGGTAPYNYAWSNAATTASITGVVAGTYTVTITDNKGCTSTSFETVTEPAILQVNVVVDSNESCTGAANGGLTAQVTGGTTAYTYMWNNAATTASNTGLSAGSYTVTVTDAKGCIKTGTASIILEDITAPTVITRNITVYLDANGQVNITAAQIDSASFDACGISTSVLDTTNFTCSDIGTNTVELKVTDVNGNVDSATATVMVLDTLRPTVVTQNATVYLDAAGESTITTADINNGSSDNCSIQSIALDSTHFDCSEVGANTVTLKVTDVNGNIDSATATVTVLDTLKPTVVTQNVTVYLDAAGEATITAADINNGSSDNCAVQTLSLDSTHFNCSEVGANTVTLKVTDASGNADSATATVMVLDTLKPTVATQNVTVYLDATGEATITATDINNGSSDNCSIQAITLDSTHFNCSEVGANTVTLKVTDVNGNADSATATVTVMDTLKPTVVTQNVTVYLDAAGEATITTSDINNGSSDNCTIQTLSLDSTHFNCGEVGANTVTLKVTDVNGNADSATATVTVLDTLKPTVVTQNATVYLNAAGEAMITAADINNGSSDNCSIQTIALDSTHFDCSETGANTVTLKVTDANGNIDSATAIVTVLDTIYPVLTVINDTSLCAEDTSGTKVVYTINATDNCTPGSIVQTAGLPSGSTFPVGITTNVFEVADASGNITRDSFDIEVYSFPTLKIDTVSVQCESNSAVTLNAIPVGGTFSGNGVTGNQFDPTVVSTGVTEITYTFTTSNVCTYSTEEYIQVNANPNVILGSFSDTVCLEQAIVACPVGTPSGGKYSGPGIDSIVLVTADAGIGQHYITYSYTDQYGCTGSDSTLANIMRCLEGVGIDDSERKPYQVKLYPNPNSGRFTLEHTGTAPIICTIYSANGALVQQLEITSQQHEISIENYPQGVYLIQITGENIHEQKRVIVY